MSKEIKVAYSEEQQAIIGDMQNKLKDYEILLLSRLNEQFRGGDVLFDSIHRDFLIDELIKHEFLTDDTRLAMISSITDFYRLTMPRYEIIVDEGA